jgi:hypothetical protein
MGKPKALEPQSTYSGKEARRRFDAALRGARIAAPQPMKSMRSKRVFSQRHKKKLAKSAS